MTALPAISPSLSIATAIGYDDTAAGDAIMMSSVTKATSRKPRSAASGSPAEGTITSLPTTQIMIFLPFDDMIEGSKEIPSDIRAIGIVAAEMPSTTPVTTDGSGT